MSDEAVARVGSGLRWRVIAVLVSALLVVGGVALALAGTNAEDDADADRSAEEAALGEQRAATRTAQEDLKTALEAGAGYVDGVQAAVTPFSEVGRIDGEIVATSRGVRDAGAANRAAEYNRLVDERNALIDQHNALADQLNAQENALTEQVKLIRAAIP